MPCAPQKRKLQINDFRKNIWYLGLVLSWNHLSLRGWSLSLPKEKQWRWSWKSTSQSEAPWRPLGVCLPNQTNWFAGGTPTIHPNTKNSISFFRGHCPSNTKGKNARKLQHCPTSSSSSLLLTRCPAPSMQGYEDRIESAKSAANTLKRRASLGSWAAN